ncbi:MAG TPA: hypothetical protein VMG10_15715 [Gemmataceae bacterium]|nr:hypothetical protein [Gemmataceae bacterium]
MDIVAAVLLLTDGYPLVKALRANRTTTLRQPLLWTLLAWSAWVGVAWGHVMRVGVGAQLATYAALCLTGCAGIAVLGARRPGVSAWNFVVVGLLAVLFLPILNGMGELRLELAQELFLAVTLAVPLLNYLPTRLASGAILAAAGCAWELVQLMGWVSVARTPWLGLLLLAVAPWAAWAGVASRRSTATAFDQLWLAYRDRFGFVWGQRMREQFNRAAHHAGWPVVLRWGELHSTADQLSPDPEQLLATLRAVLKRFGPEEQEQSSQR